jgi:hypothetical protein
MLAPNRVLPMSGPNRVIPLGLSRASRVAGAKADFSHASTGSAEPYDANVPFMQLKPQIMNPQARPQPSPAARARAHIIVEQLALIRAKVITIIGVATAVTGDARTRAGEDPTGYFLRFPRAT